MPSDLGLTYPNRKQIKAAVASLKETCFGIEPFTKMTKTQIIARYQDIKDGKIDEQTNAVFKFDKNIRVIDSSNRRSHVLSGIKFGKDVKISYKGKYWSLDECEFDTATLINNQSSRPSGEIKFVVNNCQGNGIKSLNVTNVSVSHSSISEVKTRGAYNVTVRDNSTLKNLSTEKVHLLNRLVVDECPLVELSEKQTEIYTKSLPKETSSKLRPV